MNIYSPEHKIDHPLYVSKDVEVYFKRDDMIHPFISGNKWRKLKYLIRKAQAEDKKTLVTFGGAWSNHLLATASAGAMYGFKTVAFVRGENVKNPVLDMCRLFGMELRFVSREDYKNKRGLFDLIDNKQGYFFIDEGGASIEATYGCQEIVAELHEKYDHIFCAAGTGTTAAGLAQGLALHQPLAKLHVIPVLKNGNFILEEISNLKAPTELVELHTEYHFGGYAKTKPHLIDFIRQFIRTTGIMIEPTYTGKVIYALHDLISNDSFEPNSKILMVHTGGLTGLLGQLDKFH